MSERVFTEADYVAAIPSCCSYQTIEEHKGMMLCWGLCAALRAGEKMDCTGCPLNTGAKSPDADGAEHGEG